MCKSINSSGLYLAVIISLISFYSFYMILLTTHPTDPCQWRFLINLPRVCVVSLPSPSIYCSSLTVFLVVFFSSRCFSLLSREAEQRSGESKETKRAQRSSVKKIRNGGRTRSKRWTGRFSSRRRWTGDSERVSPPEREHMQRGGKTKKEGVIPGRIWLVLGSLRGELRCNPLLSMQTWAEFHQIPLVAKKNTGGRLV